MTKPIKMKTFYLRTPEENHQWVNKKLFRAKDTPGRLCSKLLHGSWEKVREDVGRERAVSAGLYGKPVKMADF